MNGNGENEDKNQKWQRWNALASTAIAVVGAAIAVVGAIATSNYNEQQTRYREIETVEIHFEHLVSEDRRLSNMATATLRTLLPNQDLADKLIQAAVKVISEEQANKPELQFTEINERREAAQGVSIEGWAYLGNRSNETWVTRYFDFPKAEDSDKYVEDPNNYVNKKLSVSKVTGSLNLRQNMPTPAGNFPPVIYVLDPGAVVTVREVQAWQSTGYMWARVELDVPKN